ncbi:MAG: beta-Ala-His dipeptidase [Clostridia bacterium]|nr:beta-Ala-His dipeptidase [Clostridia bacterium]
MNNTLPYSTFRYPKLLRFFEEISSIPRQTYHEEQIADYLCEFAHARGLSCYRDAHQNVLITKPGTQGLEATAPLLLQGHTDMVCEVRWGKEHNFLTDPLALYVEDGWLRAKDTTLGADDGVAVAVMLALLDDTQVAHPPLECLFTASEEVGLDGAKNFDYSLLSARQMINMDSPDEQLIIAGCAGGVRSRLSVSFVPVPAEGTLFRLRVEGLFGGHSGEDIHRGRQSAIAVLACMLSLLSEQTEMHVVSINGGQRENVISRTCEAVVSVKDADAIARLANPASALSLSLREEDKNLSMAIEEVDVGSYPTMMTSEDTARILALLAAIPCGVLAKNETGFVEYSRNLGVITTTDTEDNARTLTLTLLSRSPRDDRLEESMHLLDEIVASFGGTATHADYYPGWNFAPISPLREAYIEAHKSVYGCAPEVTAIHAGLECGIIAKEVPDMDMISVGPRVLDLHSPSERMHLESFEKFYEILQNLLKNL